jgi:16S rRNA (adenine1518-N6/adenine1519-N6)-dimethyltransferase
VRIDLTDKRQLIAFLKSQNLWAKKSLGQNFLVCEEVLGDIVQAAELKLDDIVVEVGPGLGVLTRELCKRSGKVLAVEKDKRMAEMLEKTAGDFSNLEIFNEDVFKFRIQKSKIWGDKQAKYKVVANIPYYLTSHLVQHFLQSENPPQMMVLMVQWEVAERMVAKPPKMELISVLVQYYANAKIVKKVPRSCFFPEPKVDSAIVKIVREQKPNKINEKNFFRIVKAGFSAKRKTLANALSAGLHLSKENSQAALLAVGIEPSRRAETLSLEEWLKLAKKIA